MEGQQLTLTGLYEVVKKGDPPVMGITKVTEGRTLDEMKRPWAHLPMEATTTSVPATAPP